MAALPALCRRPASLGRKAVAIRHCSLSQGYRLDLLWGWQGDRKGKHTVSPGTHTPARRFECTWCLLSILAIPLLPSHQATAATNIPLHMPEPCSPKPLGLPLLIASPCALPAPTHTQHSYTVASSVEDLTGQGRGHAVQAFSPELPLQARRQGEARPFICSASGQVDSATCCRDAGCLELPRALWREISK